MTAILDSKALLERVAQLTAHRACCGSEHNPEAGKLHGYCVVCGVPWPCEYAGVPAQPDESDLIERLQNWICYAGIRGLASGSISVAAMEEVLAALQSRPLPPQSPKAESGKCVCLQSYQVAADPKTICAQFVHGGPNRLVCDRVGCGHGQACHAPADKQAGEQP